MRFDIVIPTCNNLPELQKCLESLRLLPSGDFQVLLGVDGSTDGTLEWLDSQTFPFPLLVLQHPGGINRGRAATRNLALPHLKGIHTLFLDSDMEASPDLLDAHARVLEMGNHLSIGTIQYRNTAGNVWVRYSSERGVAKFKGGAEVPFHYFITPNTAIPSAWFRTSAGFDEQISRYGGEDMELGYRLHKQFQPKFIFNEQALVQTTQPKKLQEALPQLQEYGATGLRYITKKWPELSNIYWVAKCDSKKWKDRLFEWLTKPGFQNIAKFLVGICPYFLQKLLINYLVIAHIHTGYRTGKQA